MPMKKPAIKLTPEQQAIYDEMQARDRSASGRR